MPERRFNIPFWHQKDEIIPCQMGYQRTGEILSEKLCHFPDERISCLHAPAGIVHFEIGEIHVSRHQTAKNTIFHIFQRRLPGHFIKDVAAHETGETVLFQHFSSGRAVYETQNPHFSQALIFIGAKDALEPSEIMTAAVDKYGEEGIILPRKPPFINFGKRHILMGLYHAVIRTDISEEGFLVFEFIHKEKFPVRIENTLGTIHRNQTYSGRKLIKGPPAALPLLTCHDNKMPPKETMIHSLLE